MTRDGTILGMRCRIVADVGAYFLTSTAGPPINAAHRFAGPYAIPPMDVECLSVLTNKPPTGPYRGAGGPEGASFMERTIDLIARELRLDPVAVRRRNFISPEAFPDTTATGLTYDSGDYVPALERALELADYVGFHQQQQARGYSPETWVTVESRDMGNSMMIMGTKEVPHALEANITHGPENPIHR